MMWARIKACCLNSLTIAWSYFLALAGAAMQGVDAIGDALNDPGIKDQISMAIGDPKTVGRLLLGISIVTIVARLRSLSAQRRQ
jgi:hypothetical protein